MGAPTARKILEDGRTIHTSQIIVPGNGLPLLSDLGECRFTDQDNGGEIMPNPYRAPEVILKMGWDPKVDIWNVAMLVSQSLSVFSVMFCQANPVPGSHSSLCTGLGHCVYSVSLPRLECR